MHVIHLTNLDSLTKRLFLYRVVMDRLTTRDVGKKHAVLFQPNVDTVSSRACQLDFFSMRLAEAVAQMTLIVNYPH